METSSFIKLFIDENAMLIEEKDILSKGLEGYTFISTFLILHHQYLKTKTKPLKNKKHKPDKRENLIINLEAFTIDKIKKHLNILQEFNLFKEDPFYYENIVQRSSRVKLNNSPIYVKNKDQLRTVELKRETTNLLRLGKTIISNLTNKMKKIKIEQDYYLIPMNSRFVYYDLRLFNEFLEKAVQTKQQFLFDIIMIDPPYYNKSVKNSTQYETNSFKLDKLSEFKINSILNQGGIVCVWVTNKKKYYDYVKDVVFKAFGVELAVVLYWIKITTSNDPVIDIDSSHKKPYEILLVARKGKGREIETKYIYSIPVQLHSKKPILFDYLKQFVEPKAHNANQIKYMELFARNLFPNTFSIGNECLKFQDIKHYEKINH